MPAMATGALAPAPGCPADTTVQTTIASMTSPMAPIRMKMSSRWKAIFFFLLCMALMT